ncbi:MAG: ribosome silencing factor [Planctomycetota bacterium]
MTDIDDGKRHEPLPTDQLAGLVVSLLTERKGEDIVVLKMDEVLPITDWFVVATGRNRRHVDALTEHVLVSLKARGVHARNRSGKDTGRWVLLDFGWVVVHLFQPEEREYYDLEMLWADAGKVDLASMPLPEGVELTTEEPGES